MKLNLGCGPRWKELYPDYVGLDVKDYGQEFVQDVRDFFAVTNFPPAPVNAYEEIMANHFLEHFNQDELREIFKGINEALVTGGTLKFVVPHMRRGSAWVLSHKTFWNEETVNWLGREDADSVYGFGKWEVVEVIVNDRSDMHVLLRNKSEKKVEEEPKKEEIKVEVKGDKEKDGWNIEVHPNVKNIEPPVEEVKEETTTFGGRMRSTKKK